MHPSAVVAVAVVVVVVVAVAVTEVVVQRSFGKSAKYNILRQLKIKHAYR
jgi:hypothetical protein